MMKMSKSPRKMPMRRTTTTTTMMPLSFVQDLFANKLLEDDREPFINFQIPGMEGEFGVLAPKIEFWLQLGYVRKSTRTCSWFGRLHLILFAFSHILQLLIIQTVIACLFSVVIYKYIVQQRRTTGAYLLGFGVVIPVACYAPFLLLETMDVQNRVLKMSCSTLACVVSFRCIEAMYNTSLNSAVEASIRNYMTYYSSLVNQVWDVKTNKRVPVTVNEVISHIWTITCQYLILSVVLSYLLAYNFKPFPSHVELEQFHVSWDLLQPGQLANNYLVAVLTFYTLCVGFNITGFVGNLQGFSVRDVLYNPLFRTKSPSNFWGAKWNPVIGGALKVSRLSSEWYVCLVSHLILIPIPRAARCLFASTTILSRVRGHCRNLYSEWPTA